MNSQQCCSNDDVISVTSLAAILVMPLNYEAANNDTSPSRPVLMSTMDAEQRKKLVRQRAVAKSSLTRL